MDRLPFSLDLIQWLVDHRSDALTLFFQLATLLGEVEGYVLVITLIYVAYDKRLAFRLAVLVLASMCLNHVLKSLVMNPRPFIAEGEHLDKWAVTAEKAQELAHEYSTPSGHAMSAAAFYSLLYSSVKNQYVRCLAVAAIVLTGLSRPYLAVHYFEDVVVGWFIGLMFALLIMRYLPRIGELWNRRSHGQQVAIVVAFSIALWLITLALSDWNIRDQPRGFIGYAGFLTGIMIAYPLETRHVNFDPRGSAAWRKALRFALSVGVVVVTLVVLDVVFARLSSDASVLGHLLHYLRYIAAGVAGMWVAPLLFTRMGLATAQLRPAGMAIGAAVP